MKFSLSWIREFVEIADTPADLARRLTAAGLAVETVTDAPEGDAILDIEVFSNRPDCMNVYGVAREAAAAAGRTLCPYPCALAETEAAPRAGTLARVSVEAPDLCGRYSARILRGVRIGPSPEWMVRRLATAGVRPVNNVVDATNYVLWEFGHPLHAFDLATIEGAEIRVRRARAGEAITTLDGMQRALHPDMLVIADAARPIALAGIMGGSATMVSESTVDLLIESAHFDAVSVRRTSKALAVSTDASYRFERGADIEATVMALNRACALIREIAGGTILDGVIEDRPASPTARRLRIRTARASAVLGIPLEPETIARTLTALQFRLEPRDGSFEVEVPSHRQDIDHEADLIEEVGRSVSYDAVPERLPHIPGTGAIHRPGVRREAAIRRALAAAGCAEAITSSFVSAAHDWGLRQRLSPDAPAIEPVGLENPLTSDQEILRTTILPGLLGSVSRNLNRGIKDVRLFEIGHVFRRGPAHPITRDNRKRAQAPPVDETISLALALTGSVRPHHWAEGTRDVSFHDLKGTLQGAMAECGLGVSFGPLPPSEALAAGRSALMIVEGTPVGRLGALAPEWLARFDIRQDVYVAEMGLSTVFSLPERPVRFTPLPRFPSASRDLSLIVRADQGYEEIERAIREETGGLVAAVSPADRYTGGALPPGMVGLTVNMVFRSAERTLASEEVTAIVDKVLDSLKTRFGVRLRG